MSKLFELYVLGLLKDAYGSHVLFGGKEAKLKYGLPDYLITKEGIKCIADAKYKTLYNDDNKYDIDNIRQLSGYARDKNAFTKLNIDEKEIIDCLIIYPLNDQSSILDFKIDPESFEEVGTFVGFKKIGVPIPIINRI